jgi:DNA repair protein RadC
MSSSPDHFSLTRLPLFSGDEAVAAPLSGWHPSHIRDHRQRPRDRFLDGRADALPDYELLELILFGAVPRQDMKPLAHRLLAAFGEFNSALSARRERPERVDGAGPAIVLQLRLVEVAARRLSRSRVMQRTVISSWSAVLGYCHATIAHLETEQFRIPFLDDKNILVADEEQARGTVDHVPVYPTQVVKRALELNASERIRDACEVMGAALNDHLMIGKEAQASFRSLGYI